MTRRTGTRVLNAFRHQRSLHLRVQLCYPDRRRRECSTPFGIRGLCTGKRRNNEVLER